MPDPSREAERISTTVEFRTPGVWIVEAVEIDFDPETGEWVVTGGKWAGRADHRTRAILAWLADRLGVFPDPGDPARQAAEIERLREALRRAATHLEILTGRMRGCHEETGNHCLLEEAEWFCEEARAALDEPSPGCWGGE
jgi:hypothetical protein